MHTWSIQPASLSLTLAVLCLVAQPVGGADAVFQYATPVATTKGQSHAFLWLPPEAKQIRGVVMAGMTLAERELVKDPQIRKVCADQQLAIVFLKTGLASVDVQKVLDELAMLSGYRELTVAPLFFIGHSAGGPQAKAAAIKCRERCFGVMHYRGGHPGGDDPVPPGVPALMMIGQFDEFGLKLRDDTGRENWENARDSLAAFRAQNKGNLGSIVIEPGAGHFAWSDRSAAYLALFLRKAAQARIPDWPIDTETPVTCKPIDPASGWLTDLTIKMPGHPAAPFGEYKGDKPNAAWHFDHELAQATAAYHQGLGGKKDQLLRWTDPHSVEAGARRYFNEVKWVGDGQTFEVHPVYADAYPRTGKDGKVPHWVLAGQPVGSSKAPIKVRPIGGPVVAAGAHTFRMKYDALAPATDPGRVTFLAWSDGDAEYRYTELVGMMPRGFTGLNSGNDQAITFPPVSNLKVGGDPVELKATSDSGLAVEFYVSHGPAVVENGKLRIAELPARATFPMAVKVVAYQFGRGVEPRVKTAVPVERVLRIEKP